MRMLAHQQRLLTVEEFLDTYACVAGHWELVDGVPLMMAGGSIAHADVAVNIISALRVKLRGTGCRPYNSDTGLKIDDDTVFYPDVTVYCDRRDLDLHRAGTRVFRHPSVIIEVSSPTTERYDRATKVVRYREIEAAKMVVLVDPVARTFESYTRLGPGQWRVDTPPAGSPLEIAEPAVTLTADEMFATD